MTIVILWVLMSGSTVGWATLNSYESLSACKSAQERLNQKYNVVNSICLPAGMEPK